jgi:hypothetical protein
MYITKIKLTDVRCFADAEIDLTQDKPGTSVLIAGNNGIGKSAILRAIAMGLCDSDSAASLLRELEGSYIRKRAEQEKNSAMLKRGAIDVQLIDRDLEKWHIRTTITEYSETTIEKVDQNYGRGTRDMRREFKSFSPFWNALFVTAYGAGLRTSGTNKYSEYFAPDAVYSLFRYDASLQDPEIAWRRLADASQRTRSQKGHRRAKALVSAIPDLLRYVLALQGKAEIVLQPNGIFLKGTSRELIPLDAMGDGHKSLAKLTLDILMWYLLKINYDKLHQGDYRDWKAIPTDSDGRPLVRGIVLIDEIEQHLHPKLQREILKRLHDKFPHVQFIVTTHSPLCVSGTADVGSSSVPNYRIFSLSPAASGVRVVPREVPRGLRSDQILLDYFDLPTTLNVSTQLQLDRLNGLMSIPDGKRSTKQRREIAKLLVTIRNYDFGLAEQAVARDFQRRALAFLAKSEKVQ